MTKKIKNKIVEELYTLLEKNSHMFNHEKYSIKNIKEEGQKDTMFFMRIGSCYCVLLQDINLFIFIFRDYMTSDQQKKCQYIASVVQGVIDATQLALSSVCESDQKVAVQGVVIGQQIISQRLKEIIMEVQNAA